jgi:hypothetical protein
VDHIWYHGNAAACSDNPSRGANYLKIKSHEN